MIQYDIIIRPVVTEKTSIQKEDFNQVSFEVDRRANRVEIRRAIEKIFNVKVADVKTMQVKGKVKRRGRVVGHQFAEQLESGTRTQTKGLGLAHEGVTEVFAQPAFTALAACHAQPRAAGAVEQGFG